MDEEGAEQTPYEHVVPGISKSNGVSAETEDVAHFRATSGRSDIAARSHFRVITETQSIFFQAMKGGGRIRGQVSGGFYARQATDAERVKVTMKRYL